MHTQYTKVGLGTYPFASVYKSVSNQEAEHIVKTFINGGGTIIDTAPYYGFGKVESMLGGILRSIPREKYKIGSKCGFVNVETSTEATVTKSLSYQNVINECAKSLERLHLDYLDYYYIHFPDEKVSPEETMRAMADLVKSGKILKIGICNVNLRQLKQYNINHLINYVQGPMSLLSPPLSQKYSNYLIKNKIAYVPFRVLERGLLSEKLESKSLRQIDRRSIDRNWSHERVVLVSRWIRDYLVPIAKIKKMSVSSLAIAWVLNHNYVDHVLIGQTEIGTLNDIFNADHLILNHKVLKMISVALNNFPGYS